MKIQLKGKIAQWFENVFWTQTWVRWFVHGYQIRMNAREIILDFELRL